NEEGALERFAVTRYLVSLGGPIAEKPTPQPKEHADSLKRGQQLFVSVGCIACHGPLGTPVKQKEEEEPRTFLLHGAPRLYPFKGMGGKTSPDQLAAYLRNPHTNHPTSRMPQMLLDPKEALDLAHFLCDASGPKDHKLPEMPARARMVQAFQRLETRAEQLDAFQKLSEDGQWVELGKRLVEAKGCVGCHTFAPKDRSQSNYAATPIKAISNKKKQTKGCLADEDQLRGKAPRLALKVQDRKAV